MCKEVFEALANMESSISSKIIDEKERVLDIERSTTLKPSKVLLLLLFTIQQSDEATTLKLVVIS